MAQDDYNKLGRDPELVLTTGAFAFVLDKTKGHINTLCGPTKQSLSNTDELVTFDGTRFVPSRNQADAIQSNIIVPKGSYVILENPANNGKQPEPGKAEISPINNLRYGQIENLPGPQSFPLWPGQVAKVVKGHDLRSNQYLLVRVYDDEAAAANWDKTVVKGATSEGDHVKKNNVLGIDKESLVTGQLLIIKGTAVAFYMPPTGIEVLKDGAAYVRDAVTLERLEYSILLDESGIKEYKIGPVVVFPTPTQQFFTKEGARKFRAFELQPTTGIHIKVIADYADDTIFGIDEAGNKVPFMHKAGDELFITGADTPIYYPREEHAIIAYGGNEKTFAIAIPGGEGRYVMNRVTGSIDLVSGPAMFLPDPRKQVVVRRVLTESECALYFPGNTKVLNINNQLRAKLDAEDSDVATASFEDYLGDTRMTTRSFAAATESLSNRPPAASKAAFADSLNRGTKYTPPRTITLDTKYDGAVHINVWSGFAVQVVNSKGDRRTVVGPAGIDLQYDEYLEPLSLSKGKPKSSDQRLNTAFLRYISNPVSDIISLKTQNLVNVDIQVKYLVRFEDADREKWFSVDNYVQYLVDHLRSIIGNTVRQIGIQEFFYNASNILSDTVLGLEVDGRRPLKHFTENGMTIYNLELISIQVKDQNVADLLARSRQETLVDTIELERANERLTLTAGKQNAERLVMREIATTQELRDLLASNALARAQEQRLIEIESENSATVARQTGEQEAAQIAKITKALYLETEKASKDLAQEYAQKELDRKITLLVEEAKASSERMKNVQPGLVEALVGLAQEGMFEKIAEHLAPLSIVRGESLSGTLSQLFAGTPLEGMVGNIANLSKVKTAGK